MEFSLSVNKDKLTGFQKNTKDVTNIFYRLSDDHYFQADDNGGWIVWIGDFVLIDGFNSIEGFLADQLRNSDPEKIIKTGGNFYCIRFYNETKSLQVSTGFLNIMPVYYYKDHENVLIASKPEFIIKNVEKDFRVNKKFILEKLLFNYPFENITIYQGIQMLAGNHHLRVDQTGITEVRHMDILDWVVQNPLPVHKATNHLVDLLNERIDAYLPDEEFYLSFTSGFDGRTILSRALNKNKKLITYSFGTKNSPDIVIPAAQSKKLEIQFRPFYLDEEPYVGKSLNYGLELVDATASLSNLARAHYVYASKQISNTHKYIVTGNFGSELFRAFRATGVMITPFLFQLFNTTNIEQFLDNYSFPELTFLKTANFRNELHLLKENLIHNKIITNPHFSKNQLLYKYVFEEMFRKYFGAELIMQSRYLYNRTPYIDYRLVKELMKTKLVGIYSEFNENNPAKRLKGQTLYAHCIKKNSTQLYTMKTGKGYTPKSIISLSGKVNLSWNLMNKKLKNRKGQHDEFGVLNAFEYNTKSFLGMSLKEEYFNKTFIEKAIKEEKKDMNNLINAISLNWYINRHFE